MKRIGIVAQGFTDWGGGLDFLRLTATSLRIAAPKAELHILVPTRGPLTQLRNLRDWTRKQLGKVVASNRPIFAHLERAFAETDAVIHQIDLGNNAVSAASRRLNLDGLIPAINPQSMDGTPWVGYIADFQHKRLPQFFTERECAKRNRAFKHMLNSADAVIVNAKDVAKDIDRYYSNRRARVFTMPFSPSPSTDAFSVPPKDAALRYNVRGPYFMICNQFWKHKDHDTAFKAFAAISNRHPDLLLVCTGATSDYRFPGYFDRLIHQASRMGVADRILTLGLIPKLDQLALLRGAVALVQPTLFEGGPGGGAVYDAVALGARSIVSDIPVNTEIDEPSITYFKAGDVGALAIAMEATLAACDVTPFVADPLELVQRGIERRRACGELLLEALDCAVKSRHAQSLS